MSRIVVLTNGNYYARLILDRLLAERATDVAGIVLVSGDYFGRPSIEGFFPIARQTAFPYLFAKVLQMVAFRVAAMIWPGARLSVDPLAAAHQVPTVRVTSIKEEAAISALRTWAPDLLVSVSCPQKIPNRMISTCRAGGVNIHSSLLPAVAGLAPYYWALANGLERTGTTVHYLTAKFDDGNILARRTLEIRPKESAFALFERLAVAGGDALFEAVARAEAGDPGDAQDRDARSYHSHPTIASWMALRQNGHVIVRLSELAAMISRQVRQARTISNAGAN